MEVCVCCMLLVWAIAAPVRCGNSVRDMEPPPRNRAAKVAVLWPLDGVPPEPAVPPALAPASHAILWGDWSRCQTRREWMTLLRTQTVTITDLPAASFAETAQRRPLTRRQRAHWRLSWAERQARNARARTAPGVEITLFGLPSPFATFLGLSIL